jgi:uncharacterized phage protein (predicted DNA packaging)
MILSLDEAITYLRLEDYDLPDSEMQLISDIVETADDYVKRATGFKFENPDTIPKIAKMIVRLLVSHWYEQRAIVAINQNVTKIYYSVEMLLNQLAYSYTEESETL